MEERFPAPLKGAKPIEWKWHTQRRTENNKYHSIYQFSLVDASVQLPKVNSQYSVSEHSIHRSTHIEALWKSEKHMSCFQWRQLQSRDRLNRNAWLYMGSIQSCCSMDRMRMQWWTRVKGVGGANCTVYCALTMAISYRVDVLNCDTLSSNTPLFLFPFGTLLHTSTKNLKQR